MTSLVYHIANRHRGANRRGNLLRQNAGCVVSDRSVRSGITTAPVTSTGHGIPINAALLTHSGTLIVRRFLVPAATPFGVGTFPPPLRFLERIRRVSCPSSDVKKNPPFSRSWN